MSRESDLLTGLVALQMNVLQRDQLVEAVGAWLVEEARVGADIPPRTLSRMLLDLGHIEAEPLTAIRNALPGGGSRVSIDPRDRDALLALAPPPWIRSLLASLPEKKRVSPDYAPIPREERYRLGGQIGRGGVGRVVEGEDRELTREVAIKLTPAQGPAGSAERFVREARLAARLEHPNIVPVYDLGELLAPGGERELFLCMKRVRGRNLRELIRAIDSGSEETAKWSRARLLGVFQQVCLAVAYAHAQGVIHRDLKPANVMVGEYGETYVVDWGLAKQLGSVEVESTGGGTTEVTDDGDQTQLTLAGSVMGTPAYMSPEQAAGRLEEVDVRSDIFSLGSILWALLAGKSRFTGRTWDEELELARLGKFIAPSLAVEARRAAGLRPGLFSESVPAELDAVCAKAMKFQREERYATALEIHSDVQLFLEGVQERARLRAEALEGAARGIERLRRYCELADRIREQQAAVEALYANVPSWTPLEQKKPLHDADRQLRELREERIRCFTDALGEFRQARGKDPGCAEAEAGECELLQRRFLEAEAAGNADETMLYRRLLFEADRSGAFRARLDAPGTMSVRAFTFECKCFTPLAPGALRVSNEPGEMALWNGGSPLPASTARPGESQVPWFRVSPAGFGHRAGCPRREIPGIEVWAARYEERGFRLVPAEPRLLGITPLVDTPLAQGSWRCELRPPAGIGLAPVIFPVRIDRGGSWRQDVTLYAESEIPKGFRLVPGGPFLCGGPNGGGDEALTTEVTRDVFVSRFPVTAGEYLEFLNDLAASGRGDEARRRQPREGDRHFWEEEAGPHFRLPTSQGEGAWQWKADWPILAVNWHDAIAYTQWRSAREGRFLRLLNEREWEKSARGVDARRYSYGNHFDATFCHVNLSVQGKARPLPVGSFPLDESPYGLGDLSGGALTWCLNRTGIGLLDVCGARGGCWAGSQTQARAGYRQGLAPDSSSQFMGFRLACDPMSWE